MMTDAERSAAFKAEFKKREDEEARRELTADVDDLAARMVVASFGNANDAWSETEMRFVVEQAFKMAHVFVAARERRRA